jgi:LmbE family N-acetylglucosaminyl deacetylase
MLAVLAHPDDESFGPGGTLALYARKGVETHLACATRGEVGDIPDELKSEELDFAQHRENELHCAAGVLGLTSVHMLDYRDSGMPGSPDNTHPEALAAAPVEEVAGKIAILIREIQPQVIITFDPIGGYHHPDHIAVHKATVLAYTLAADPDFDGENLPPHRVQKLYYHTFPRRWLRTMVHIMPLLGKDPTKWGRNGDIDMTAIAAQNFPITTRINISSVREVKENASACHRSQLEGGSPSRSLLSKLIAALNPHEDFMRAEPPVNGTRMEKDLFAGVKP